jgi:hypothetical protein
LFDPGTAGVPEKTLFYFRKTGVKNQLGETTKIGTKKL